MPKNVILVKGKKFMWDGVDYPGEDKTLENMNKYRANGFEVELQEENGKSYLYTRKVVKEVVVSQH
jgi:hypothetical protein